MLPGLASSRPTDRYETNVVALGQFAERDWGRLFAGLSDLSDGFVRQLGKMLVGTVGFVAAFFAVHVVHVGLVVAQEQVRGSDAGPVVTTVQDESAFRNGTVFEFPRDSVSRQYGPLFSSCPTTGTDGTVAPRGFQSSPNPATGFHVRLSRTAIVNSHPEPFDVWRPFLFVGSTHSRSLTKASENVHADEHIL
jgi:hypothetical protein